jgi:putative transposase
VFPAGKMCELLKISRSGYYDWLKRPMGKRKIETQEIIDAALKSYKESRGMCGLDKMLRDVRESFLKCSSKRLHNI